MKKQRLDSNTERQLSTEQQLREATHNQIAHPGRTTNGPGAKANAFENVVILFFGVLSHKYRCSLWSFALNFLLNNAFVRFSFFFDAKLFQKPFSTVSQVFSHSAGHLSYSGAGIDISPFLERTRACVCELNFSIVSKTADAKTNNHAAILDYQSMLVSVIQPIDRLAVWRTVFILFYVPSLKQIHIGQNSCSPQNGQMFNSTPLAHSLWP